MNLDPLFLLIIGYAIVSLIITIPLYFYWDRKFIRFEINAQSLKYITYALFLIFSEFFLVSLGFIKINNIDLNFDKFLILALINSFLLAPILE